LVIGLLVGVIPYRGKSVAPRPVGTTIGRI